MTSSKSGEKQAKAGRGGNVPPPSRRWKKGQSGNPKGRPKKAESLKQLQELLVAWFNETDSKGKSNLEKQIAQLAKNKSDKAKRLLFEYGYGKVPQPITGEDGGPVHVHVTVGKQ